MVCSYEGSAREMPTGLQAHFQSSAEGATEKAVPMSSCTVTARGDMVAPGGDAVPAGGFGVTAGGGDVPAGGNAGTGRGHVYRDKGEEAFKGAHGACNGHHPPSLPHPHLPPPHSVTPSQECIVLPITDGIGAAEVGRTEAASATVGMSAKDKVLECVVDGRRGEAQETECAGECPDMGKGKGRRKRERGGCGLPCGAFDSVPDKATNEERASVHRRLTAAIGLSLTFMLLEIIGGKNLLPLYSASPAYCIPLFETPCLRTGPRGRVGLATVQLHALGEEGVVQFNQRISLSQLCPAESPISDRLHSMLLLHSIDKAMHAPSCF